MARWVDWLVVGGLLAPWIGMIVLVLVQSHLSERIVVLEREVLSLKETVRVLTKDLGWKES